MLASISNFIEDESTGGQRKLPPSLILLALIANEIRGIFVVVSIIQTDAIQGLLP